MPSEGWQRTPLGHHAAPRLAWCTCARGRTRKARPLWELRDGESDIVSWLRPGAAGMRNRVHATRGHPAVTQSSQVGSACVRVRVGDAFVAAVAGRYLNQVAMKRDPGIRAYTNEELLGLLPAVLPQVPRHNKCCFSEGLRDSMVQMV